MSSGARVLQAAAEEAAYLRVAMVTETYPPEVNGVAMMLSHLVDGLQRRHHGVQLIRPRQNPAEIPACGDRFEEVLQGGIAIPRYDGLRIGLPARRALQRLWSLKRPDMVHIATEGPLGWSALIASLKLDLPVSTGFHTNFHSYSRHYRLGFLEKPIAAYLRKFHNRSLATLVPTDQMRKDLGAQGFDNLRVVARGVDTKLFSPVRRSDALRAHWGAGGDSLVVTHVGRLAPEKNLALVIEAFNAMREKAPAARLVLVGDGPERSVLQRRHPGVIFAGMRTGQELAAHFASADVFLFPSQTETFGNVTLEAMASGLAVVAYDYAAARQHLSHDISGLLAPLGDCGAFVALAAALAGAPARIGTLRIRARSAAEKIDWTQILDDFEAVLRDVMQRRNSIQP